MQIVIDIPDRIYKMICNNHRMGVIDCDIIHDAIAKGTPLPKGHGRILDEKDILNTFAYDGQYYDLVDMPEYIAGVKEIIEADKAESEE